MKKVDFFNQSIKFEGDIDDYTLDDLTEAAQLIAFDHPEDAFVTSVYYMNHVEADFIHGRSWITKVDTKKHIVSIAWAFIDPIRKEF